jgi:rhodanese-related sulfurtransferase
MIGYVDSKTLKTWLSDEGEIALIDVREHGQYGEGHLFFAVSSPYSSLELRIPSLVPNSRVRLVLYDDGDGVAERAAGRAEALGYRRIHVLRGGAAAWKAAGYTLYAGLNVPSKTFGELVELELHTPVVTADELKAWRDAGENLVIVDGRPLAEFSRASIPGGVCCPNGELALRIDDIVPDPQTTIVVNCAGRTRSIIGAQTLIDLGIPNPVHALENGTQGWRLAGFRVESRAVCQYREVARPRDVDARRTRARNLGELRGVRYVEVAEVAAWISNPERTTYLIDVRTEEEYAADGPEGFLHAPGGQLVQATDQWIGVRGARIVVADSEHIRAPVIAGWLRQLGHDAHVLAGGVAAGGALAGGGRSHDVRPPSLPSIESADLPTLMAKKAVQIIDLRSSMAYREGHIPGAKWSIRPRIACACTDSQSTVVLISDQADIAELAAIDLGEGGFKDIRCLDGNPADWGEAEIPILATPDTPTDTDCIDYLFFTHRRHLGSLEDSRKYLAWEVGLIEQLDEQERASFNIVSAAP